MRQVCLSLIPTTSASWRASTLNDATLLRTVLFCFKRGWHHCNPLRQTQDVVWTPRQRCLCCLDVHWTSRQHNQELPWRSDNVLKGRARRSVLEHLQITALPDGFQIIGPLQDHVTDGCWFIARTQSAVKLVEFPLYYSAKPECSMAFWLCIADILLVGCM